MGTLHSLTSAVMKALAHSGVRALAGSCALLGIAFAQSQTDARIIKAISGGSAVTIVKTPGQALRGQKSPQEITLTLVDGKTGDDMGVIEDEGAISRAAFAGGARGTFTIRADVSNGGARSVRFLVNESLPVLDATAPFTMFGDHGPDPDDYFRGPLPQAPFVLRVIAYAGPDGQGAALAEKAILVDVQ